ncbi:hypothetical protein [Archangium lansingense]|uniref:Lipoprotein n=1 Tax=Archangium lansingense TaxID=2995310 RepID=A0ABT4A1L5_9BACT|nr:hypothetical protein [Archangium lansinium]MCY1075530.1 hypothetical protein [Archangium lansinium]
MRASSIISSVMLAAALTGCSGELPTQPGTSTPYTDLPPVKTTVSGIIFDPEAFHFAAATFPPGDPSDPTAPPPPPRMLVLGIPYMMRATPVGAQVSVMNGGTVADSSSDTVTPGATWQLAQGVPRDESITYAIRAEASQNGIVIGAAEAFPAPDFEPMPQARYHPTTSLSPLRTLNTSCVSQIAMVVGEAGALSALATHTGNSINQLLTGGVALVWVLSPGFFFDFENNPLGGVEMTKEAGPGTVYALDWAKPGTVAGQSPMGFYVSSEPVSPLGYYAVVVPPGATDPVALGFKDTVNTPEGEQPGEFGPRPFPLAPASIQVGPGVSVMRTSAFPSLSFPPPPPDEEYVPGTDMSFLCR